MILRLLNNKAFIYLFGELVSKISPFIALPLLTRALTPEEYAIYSLFTVTVFFSYILSSLATTAYIPVVFFKEKNNLKTCVTTIISISNVILVVAASILLLFFTTFVSLKTYFYCFFGALIVGYLSVSYQVVLSLYQCESKANKYVVFSILRSLLFLAFTVTAFFLEAKESKTYIMLYGLAYLVLFPFVVLILAKRLSFEIFKFKIDKKVLYFGLPSMPNALANWFKTSIDRYMILLSLGTVSLGLYSVAYQLAFGCVVVSSALAKALNPQLYEILNLHGFDSKAKNLCRKYFLIFSCIVVVYSVFLYGFASDFVGANYLNTDLYSSLLVFSALFQGGASFFVGVIFYNEKVRYALFCNLISFGVHIAILFIVSFLKLPLLYFILASIIGSALYFLLILKGALGFTSGIPK